MSLLARYLLRQLVAPFCFALAALTSLVAGGWLNPDAVVVVEEAASETIEAPSALSLIERRDYGETQIGFYFQSGQSVM